MLITYYELTILIKNCVHTFFDKTSHYLRIITSTKSCMYNKLLEYTSLPQAVVPCVVAYCHPSGRAILITKTLEQVTSQALEVQDVHPISNGKEVITVILCKESCTFIFIE